MNRVAGEGDFGKEIWGEKERTAVGFAARINAGAVGHVPLVRPVAVDVGADAGAVGVRWHAVRTPEPVCCLAVDEAVGVQHWYLRQSQIYQKNINHPYRSSKPSISQLASPSASPLSDQIGSWPIRPGPPYLDRM